MLQKHGEAMARIQSAGTLLYRQNQGSLEVLLVHPSGAYNRNAPWGIPKGIPDPGETLEAAARRETMEETGVEAGELLSLGWMDYQKSRKRLHAFCGPAPQNAAPHCASWEVDRAEFVPIERARSIIHLDHVAFLDRLLAYLEQHPGKH